MIVNLGTTITRIGYIQPNDLVFNNGPTIAYVDTDQAAVIQAPLSGAMPIQPSSALPWAGNPGMLYGIDPTGGNPGVGITQQAGLPFRLP